MKRMTVVADEDLLLQMRHLAQRRGTTFTSVLEDAMRAYLAVQQPRSSIEPLFGIVSSKKPIDHGDGRDEEALEVGVQRVYGLSPEPPGGWGD